MLPQLPRNLRFVGHALIPLAALFAILPLLLKGPSCGHDFDFHLLNWLEASTQFAHRAFPQWAYTPAFNAGEPRFIFYPPLSWCLGALLGLALPWSFVPAAFTWIALTLSGLTFHSLARRYTSAPTATVAAILYLANPYMLFTAYERTAFAELLAAAWLPLLFAAALAPYVRILPLAVPLALLWLTNAPAAVMSTYALAFLILVRLIAGKQSSQVRTLSLSTPKSTGGPSIESHPKGWNVRGQSRLHLALNTAAGTAIGLALAAFYILPAAYERRFVQIQMLVIEGMRVSDHFLFHHMPGPTADDRFHDAVVRIASLIALTLLSAITAAFIFLMTIARSSEPEQGTASPSAAAPSDPQISSLSLRPTLLPLGVLTLTIALLLTPISLPIWTHLPDLAFLQFPWRLNALLGLIFALCAAIALRRLPTPGRALTAVISLFLVAALVAPSWHLFHQTCELEDAVPARVALFHSNLGTEPTDEYTPIDADPDALHPHDPPYWLLPADPAGLNAPAPPNSIPGQAPAHISLTLPTSTYLVLNRRQYPAWQPYLNHTLIHPVTPRREDGLITLLLPPGSDTVDLTLTRTPDQTAGLLISAFALLMALGIRLTMGPALNHGHLVD